MSEHINQLSQQGGNNSRSLLSNKCEGEQVTQLTLPLNTRADTTTTMTLTPSPVIRGSIKEWPSYIFSFLKSARGSDRMQDNYFTKRGGRHADNQLAATKPARWTREFNVTPREGWVEEDPPPPLQSNKVIQWSPRLREAIIKVSSTYFERVTPATKYKAYVCPTWLNGGKESNSSS